MSGVTERQFNRSVLKYMDQIRGIPQSIEDLHGYVSNLVRRTCEPQVQRAIEYLESAGYVERCQATAADAPLWKITAAGTKQINRMVKPAELDSMIWEGV